MSFNQKGQTKKLLKFLKSIENPCCDCPDISKSEGNIIECLPDGLFAQTGAGYTDEQAQDAVGGILNPDEFIYDDATPLISINELDWSKIINAPSFVTGAENGVSLNGSTVVLGQDVGEVGNPAILTSNREIPDGGFTTYTTGAGRRWFGQRAVEGTNFNFFDSANILAYSEVTLSGHIGPKNFAAYRYIHMENGDSIGGYTNNFTSSVFRLKGTTTLTGTDLTSIGFNLLFSRAASGFGSPLVVNGPTVPTNPATNQRLITGATNAGVITYNGFYSGTDYRLQLNTGTHTMELYSDIVLGNSVISGGSTVATRYGLYINPIKQSFVTGTGYSIFQAGTTDINHLAGVLRLTNLPVFADDATAGAGGVTTNTVYKTATGELRIKL